MSKLSQSAANRALDELNDARDAWLNACAERGLDPMEQSSAMLSIGREFLPACARRALRGGSMPVDTETKLYTWLTSQLPEVRS